MKNSIDDINGWLYHRIRMCIWKQWKKPKTKLRNLMKMGERAKRYRMASRHEPTWLLVHNTYGSSQQDDDKRKTDKQWFL